jgi:mannose-6-phosphate isomerase-like protein (cupin superfamily)
MRSFTTLPAASLLFIACGREPRVATTPPSEPTIAADAAGIGDPSTIGANTTAPTTGMASAAPAASATAAPPAPSPIDGRLPSPESLALSNKASCPAKTCRLEGSLLQALLGPAESHSPAGIWEEDIGANAVVSFARRADIDVLGVVLAGNIVLAAEEGKGGGAELVPWHTFVAPGGGITLRAKGGSARIVLVVVTAGDAVAAKIAGEKSAPWTTRPAPIASVDLNAMTDLTWGKGAYHARIAFAAEASPRASLGLLKMSENGAVSPHEHEKEWEHMAILQGEGDFVQGSGDGERRLHATDGTMFSVAPAIPHQWKSAGTRSFLGIQVYTPPGPEQRFKKLAAAP